jgi:hypothetical protein
MGHTLTNKMAAERFIQAVPFVRDVGDTLEHPFAEQATEEVAA